MNMKHWYGILNGIGVVLLLLILMFGFVLYLAPHLGWRIDGVRTGSMSPTITRGTLVVAAPVKPETVALNDIIIFRSTMAENDISHRVIGITRNSPLEFYTKGDANAVPDPERVPARNVVARVVFHAPLIGFAAMFMKTPVGFLASVVVPGITIAYIFLTMLRSELSGKKKGA
jgi:signal peptidase